MSDREETPSLPASPLVLAVREAAAATCWIYSIIKLAVFDVDTYAVHRLAPTYHWVLEFKLLFLATVVAILVVAIGQRRFAAFALYVLAYPLILGWRLLLRALPLALSQWAFLVAFAPAIHHATLSFGTTFAWYTTFLVSTVAITFSDRPTLHVGAMVGLAVFQAAHFYRCIRRSYSSLVFTKLASVARSIGGWIQRQELQSSSGTTPQVDADPNDGLAFFYVLESLVSRAASKIVAQQRKYDIYLMASWFYTVLLTSVVFAFEYFGLSRIDPSAFRNGEAAGFWSYWSLSVGVLTTSNVSTLVPLNAAATAFCSVESLCSALILVILVFTVLTASRETFRTDIQQVSDELHKAATACRARATLLYQVDPREWEQRIARSKHLDAVNSIRRSLGQTVLVVTPARPDAQSG